MVGYKRRETEGATQQTAFRFEKDTYERLRRAAFNLNMSMNLIVVEAVEAWLKKYEKKGGKKT